jgi:predicted TIM-barrel fold metal-dependent hydrolase
MSSVNLMMSPVCRKYPGLKFVFSEGGIGWLPNAIERPTACGSAIRSTAASTTCCPPRSTGATCSCA